MPHPFERDLSYLQPFLGRITAYAESLPEPQRGALLAQLDGEVSRWATIQSLLDGAAPAETSAVKTPAEPAEPAAETPLRPARQAGWTIGPLSASPLKP